MNRGLLVLLVGGAVLALGCSSDDEVIERELVFYDIFPVPLEALAGSYEFAAELQDDPPRQRSTGFAIPEPVADFSRLRLVVEGAWTAGVKEIAYDIGGGNTVYDTIPAHGRLQFELTIPSDPEKFYYAVFMPQGDGFSIITDIEAGWSGGAVNAEDLLKVGLEATLSCDLGLGDNDRLLEPSTGVVSATWLELRAADVYEETGGSWPPLAQ